jgi:hypothetical protein
MVRKQTEESDPDSLVIGNKSMSHASQASRSNGTVKTESSKRINKARDKKNY